MSIEILGAPSGTIKSVQKISGNLDLKASTSHAINKVDRNKSITLLQFVTANATKPLFAQVSAYFSSDTQVFVERKGTSFTPYYEIDVIEFKNAKIQRGYLYNVAFPSTSIVNLSPLKDYTKALVFLNWTLEGTAGDYWDDSFAKGKLISNNQLEIMSGNSYAGTQFINWQVVELP